MSTHSLCFEQKCEKYENFYLKIFILLVVKFSIYLNRRVFVMDITRWALLCLHCFLCHIERSTVITLKVAF